MPTTKSIGDRGEAAATAWLEKKGYVIRERNYRYKRNEIDIVAEKDEILIFIEVKQRNTTAFGFPEDSVDGAKEERILEAAENYIYENDWFGDVRYDIISIIKNKGREEIKHFEDAF